jgi:hypothetical protein
MNAVLGLTSSLLDTNLDDDQRRTVMVIHDESQNLLELLNGVLDFQKLEGNRVEFESIAFSTRRLLDGSLQVFEPRAAAKGVAMRREYAEDLPAALSGDYARIRQVLLNLLSNAVKFTQEGRVTLAARCLRFEKGMAEIEWRVTDTGLGIANDRVDALFEDFVQADTSINRRFGGSGLGLAICKRIVEKMGGKISVATTLGVGSTFSFTLALAVAEAPAETADDRTGEKAFVAHITALGRKLRILVVDDIATNRMVIRKLFRPFDIDIDEANDGSQAVAAASLRTYDAILMDIRMPVMNGFEATRAIRTGAGASAQARIIAFTANAFPDDVKRCAAVGMDDFVAKPVQRQAVIDAILREQRAFSGPSPAICDAGAASTVAVDDAPLMDRKVFDELADAVGADTADDILNMFVRDAVKRLESLRHLSRDHDREAIKIEAHSLKSEAASLGLLRLSQLARMLELSSCDIGSGEITEMIDRLAATFELTRRELSCLLAA